MERPAHIIVVDDDREIRDLLARFFVEHGYQATTTVDTRGMDRILRNGGIDLVILDIMMRGEDGLSACRRLRASSAIPIIMLTAMGEDVDRVVGLELGADDYLTKPFNPRELLARVRALLRRVEPKDGPTAPATEQVEAERKEPVYVFSDWRFVVASRSLTSPAGVQVELRGGEYDLLTAFLTHPQRILSRDQLLDLTRGETTQLFDRAIDVQICRLRSKIETDPNRPMLIRTVRGGGYMFAQKVTME
jgi:DNA-binding response OmpR family regulator